MAVGPAENGQALYVIRDLGGVGNGNVHLVRKMQGGGPLEGEILDLVGSDVGSVLEIGAQVRVLDHALDLLPGSQVVAEIVPGHLAAVSPPDAGSRADREDERYDGDGEKDPEDDPEVPLEVPLNPRNHECKRDRRLGRPPALATLYLAAGASEMSSSTDLRKNACSPRRSIAAPNPDNGGIKLPAGFCAFLAVDGIGNARHIAVAPN